MGRGGIKPGNHGDQVARKPLSLLFCWMQLDFEVSMFLKREETLGEPSLEMGNRPFLSFLLVPFPRKCIRLHFPGFHV